MIIPLSRPEISASHQGGLERKVLRPGVRFGRLTLLRREYPDTKRQWWLCHCDCGKETTVRADKLKDGRKKSCGCLYIEITRISERRLQLERHREEVRKIRAQRRLADRYSGISKRFGSPGGKHKLLTEVMHRSGVPSTDPLWSIGFYASLIADDECYYCGGSLNEQGVSLDWIEGLAYLANNAVPSCNSCKSFRGLNSFTFKDMELLSSALELIRIRKEVNEHRDDCKPNT